MKFSPCRGGNACTQGGTHCEGCGRGHDEIAATRDLINAVAQYAFTMGYANLDEFTQFVAMKAAGKVRFMQSQGVAG